MQPGYIPPQGVMPIQFVENPLQELAQSKSAIIKQRIELPKITECGTKNRYHVYVQKKCLFKCKEESGCCESNCCPFDARPFSIKIKHISGQNQMNEDFTKGFAEFKRPFKCTCCCLARPSMSATYAESGVFFGKVIEAFSCCDPIFNVYDKDKAIKYRITCDCCQCGFCCRNSCCGKLFSVNLNIHDGNDVNMTGKPVGTIKKKCEGIQQLITDNTYILTFPENASPEEKLMLIGAVLLLDYRYYEDNGCEVES